MIDGIIDINHNNPFTIGMVRDRGVVACIHKATEGLSFVDPLYRQRRALAAPSYLYWGAYHFSAFGDGVAQAKHFLSIESGTDPNVLLALDYEPSPGGAPNMTIPQAHDFVNYVHDTIGRWPFIYGGGGLLREALTGKLDGILTNCPLWLADYRQLPQSIHPTWANWTLLQYKEDQDSVGWDWNRYDGNLDVWPNL